MQGKIVAVGGELCHAVRKTPRFLDQEERVEGPLPIEEDEAALALTLLRSYASDALYARIDLARDPDGRPSVMELELIEPSLFFAQRPATLERYCDHLLARLR